MNHKYEEIVKAIKSDGCKDVSAYMNFYKSDFSKICTDTQSAIDQKKIYIPTKPIDINSLVKFSEEEMKAFQDQVIKTNKISNETLNAGEKVWRKEVPSVTVKNPLYNLQSIKDIVFNENIFNIASLFLGGSAKITFVKVKKSYANLNIYASDQKYHSDDNSHNFLKIIIYLNDIGVEDGGFHYVKNTRADVRLGEYTYYNDIDVSLKYPKENIINFTGKAGSAMFADTLGIHKGGKPTNKDRFALFLNFGLEREYEGSQNDQAIKKELYESLNHSQKEMCEFMIVED